MENGLLNGIVVTGASNHNKFCNAVAMFHCQHGHANDVGLSEWQEYFILSLHSGGISGTNEDTGRIW